jgi:integrase/recombinase XerD
MAIRVGVRQEGPLCGYAVGFGEELARRGYAPFTIERHLALLASLGGWLREEGLQVEDLTPARVAWFLDFRRAAGHRRMVTRTGMSALLEHLGSLGVLPPPGPSAPSAAQELVERYGAYLLRERGVVERVAADFVWAARLFLSRSLGDAGVEGLEALTAREVVDFVVSECRVRRPSRAKSLIAATRSFLRFLYVEGLIATPLAQAVPTVGGWHGSSLPRGLQPAEVTALLGSCDRRTRAGRRDYAILLLLVRLGLRAGEVVALQLDDLEWRAGQIRVRGKGRSEERLPLPVDVGEAVAGYLRRGRPACEHRFVFVRVIAPLAALHSHAVTMIVRRACERAGLSPVGAHCLRHTAATQTLRAGASLSEVGQLLRHRSLGTTAIYAKVDQAALGALARPWPGGGA